MNATLSSGRHTVLVIHDDGEALDFLVRLFEAAGFDVVTAVAGFRAQAYLEGDRKVDLVIAPWDTDHLVGGEVYRWVLHHRYDLRDQFVFVGGDPPDEFDQIVAGRCLMVAMRRPADIVRVALAAIKRRDHFEAMRDAAFDADTTRARLLLIDDDPILLMVIGDLLGEPYQVTRVENGVASIALLEAQDFEVVVADWVMDGGGGAELYRWLAEYRPSLTQRIVFLSTTAADESESVAPGRPMFRKGQDSAALTAVLHEIVCQVRGESSPGLAPPEV